MSAVAVRVGGAPLNFRRIVCYIYILLCYLGKLALYSEIEFPVVVSYPLSFNGERREGAPPSTSRVAALIVLAKVRRCFHISLDTLTPTMFRRAVEDISTGSDSDYSKYVTTKPLQAHLSHPPCVARYIHSFMSPPSRSESCAQWIYWFLSCKGNEYFCEVEEEYILDRFNLTGLNTEVTHYAQALDLITDNLGQPLNASPSRSLTQRFPDDDIQDELRGSLDVQARLLYGLIHARWIVTARGLAKMVRVGFLTAFSITHVQQLEKYKRADFGRCPRVLCQSQPLLPVGLTDIPYEKSVKLYCGRCEDIYSPKSSRHGSIDGAYFGTSFPHLLFLVYPSLIPPKSGPIDLGPSVRGGQDSDPNRRSRRPRDEQDLPAESMGEGISTASVALKADRYRPRIFGFQVHEIAKLQRWQEAVRDRCVPYLITGAPCLYSATCRQVAKLEELEDVGS